MLFTQYEIEVSKRVLEKELDHLKECYKWNKEHAKHILEDYYIIKQKQLKDMINALETTIFKINTLN